MIIENTPQIETARLILRKASTSDLEDMHELLGDNEVNRYLPFFKANSIEETKAFLNERFIDAYKREQAYRYVISLKDTGKVIGYIVYSISASHDTGYALNRKYWSKGYATEALIALLSRVKEAGFPFASATHDQNNPKSGEVLKRAGMKYHYSYRELWQPKNIEVIFRFYQINYEECKIYEEYKRLYPDNFVEIIW